MNRKEGHHQCDQSINQSNRSNWQTIDESEGLQSNRSNWQTIDEEGLQSNRSNWQTIDESENEEDEIEIDIYVIYL